MSELDAALLNLSVQNKELFYRDLFKGVDARIEHQFRPQEKHLIMKESPIEISNFKHITEKRLDACIFEDVKSSHNPQPIEKKRHPRAKFAKYKLLIKGLPRISSVDLKNFRDRLLHKECFLKKELETPIVLGMEMSKIKIPITTVTKYSHTQSYFALIKNSFFEVPSRIDIPIFEDFAYSSTPKFCLDVSSKPIFLSDKNRFLAKSLELCNTFVFRGSPFCVKVPQTFNTEFKLVRANFPLYLFRLSRKNPTVEVPYFVKYENKRTESRESSVLSSKSNQISPIFTENSSNLFSDFSEVDDRPIKRKGLIASTKKSPQTQFCSFQKEKEIIYISSCSVSQKSSLDNCDMPVNDFKIPEKEARVYVINLPILKKTKFVNCLREKKIELVIRDLTFEHYNEVFSVDMIYDSYSSLKIYPINMLHQKTINHKDALSKEGVDMLIEELEYHSNLFDELWIIFEIDIESLEYQKTSEAKLVDLFKNLERIKCLGLKLNIIYSHDSLFTAGIAFDIGEYLRRRIEYTKGVKELIEIHETIWSNRSWLSKKQSTHESFLCSLGVFTSFTAQLVLSIMNLSELINLSEREMQGRLSKFVPSKCLVLLLISAYVLQSYQRSHSSRYISCLSKFD